VSSKIGVIESLIGTVDKIILGGGMIFTFYKSRGISVSFSPLFADFSGCVLHFVSECVVVPRGGLIDCC
jgi:3-phosphoglycerate kinase